MRRKKSKTRMAIAKLFVLHKNTIRPTIVQYYSNHVSWSWLCVMLPIELGYNNKTFRAVKIKKRGLAKICYCSLKSKETNY